jgi:hypothetical protein
MSGPWERQDVEDAEIQCHRCHRYFPKATMVFAPLPLAHNSAFRWYWFCATCYARLNRRNTVAGVIVLVAAVIIAFAVHEILHR